MRLKSTLLVLFAVSSSPNALTLEESVTLSLDSSPSLLARYSRYESMVRDRNAINGSFLLRLICMQQQGTKVLDITTETTSTVKIEH